jgi:hypothetical protein
MQKNQLHDYNVIALEFMLLFCRFPCFTHTHTHTQTTTVNNFVDCGFVAPYYKILRLTHYILPQNSPCWLLCKSANVGIAAVNTAERYLQEGPIQLPLW